MSRSYKKAVIYKYKNRRFAKRQASKVVRRNSEIPNGSGFKRFYYGWNICNFRNREVFYTAEEYRRKWFDRSDREFDWERRRFQNWKEAYRHWLKWYRKK